MLPKLTKIKRLKKYPKGQISQESANKLFFMNNYKPLPESSEARKNLLLKSHFIASI